jgi:hypothetical protein
VPVPERSPDEIQRDIERSRAALAAAVDQLAYRTNPKRVSEQVRAAVLERARSPQGQAVLGAVGLVVLVLVVRRVRKH